MVRVAVLLSLVPLLSLGDEPRQGHIDNWDVNVTVDTCELSLWGYIEEPDSSFDTNSGPNLSDSMISFEIQFGTPHSDYDYWKNVKFLANELYFNFSIKEWSDKNSIWWKGIDSIALDKVPLVRLESPNPDSGDSPYYVLAGERASEALSSLAEGEEQILVLKAKNVAEAEINFNILAMHSEEELKTFKVMVEMLQLCSREYGS